MRESQRTRTHMCYILLVAIVDTQYKLNMKHLNFRSVAAKVYFIILLLLLFLASPVIFRIQIEP
uniref:Uncharacterized protein n=1 Tax=Romanomermis culicivorax TaxID=13658 RepID=A0A915L379_ROMCU